MALNINGTTGISGVDGSVSAPALTGTDSNTGITFPAADTIKFATGGVERMSITNSGISGITQGKILQVVQFRKTDTFTSSANGFVDVGVGVNITPSATSSKILITVSISGYVHAGSGGAGKIVRTISGTATDLGKADASGSRQVSSFSGSIYTGDGTSSDLLQLNANTQFLDSPNTTSQINYKVQCHPENNTMRLNYQETSLDNTASGIMTTSYITCMEVAA